MSMCTSVCERDADVRCLAVRSPNMLRESLAFKLSLGPGGGTLVRVPYVIKLKVLQVLPLCTVHCPVSVVLTMRFCLVFGCF